MSAVEHEFDGIVQASYGPDETLALAEEAQPMSRMRSAGRGMRRSGPGVLRRRITCSECGDEITGAYLATKVGPVCQECTA